MVLFKESKNKPREGLPGGYCAPSLPDPARVPSSWRAFGKFAFFLVLLTKILSG